MLFRRLLRTAFVAGLAAAASSAACSGKKNTELVIAIQTDMRIPKDLDAVTLEIADQNGNMFMRQSFLVGPDGLHLPATIGVVAKSPSDVIDITVTGQFGDLYPEDKEQHGHVVRRARFSFAEGRTGLVRMPLRFSCYDFQHNCTDGQTCVAGVCKVISAIDGASLPEFTPDQVYGAGSNTDGVGGKCWDPATCLQANVVLAKSHDDTSTGECFFPIGSAPVDGADGGVTGDPDGSAPRDAGGSFKFKALDPTKPLNVFMVVTEKDHGFCDDTGTCRVPLDQDVEEGWHYDDSKTNVVLPIGLCTKIAAGAHLEASDACETKVPNLPLCDVDSKLSVGSGPDAGSGDAAVDAGDDASFDAAPTDAGSDGSATLDSGAGDKCGVPTGGMPATTDALLAGYTFAPGSVGVDQTGGTPLTAGGKVGGLALAVDSCPGNELDFDGTTYLQGNVPKLASTTNGFTISYWLNTIGTALPPNETVLSTLTPNTGFEFGSDASGQPFGIAYFTGGVVNMTVTGVPVSPGWHHVVTQWMGAGQPIRTYIDGFLVSTSTTPVGTFKPAALLSIGRTRYPTVGKPLTLPLGDLRIYGH
ncbi:MAG: LamG domain-containing protein [Polyangiales bacterium]